MNGMAVRVFIIVLGNQMLEVFQGDVLLLGHIIEVGVVVAIPSKSNIRHMGRVAI